MNDYINRIADDALEVSGELRQVPTARKNAVLTKLAALLQEHAAELKAENARDIAYARETGLEASLVDRLTISDKVIQSMSRAALEIAAFFEVDRSRLAVRADTNPEQHLALLTQTTRQRGIGRAGVVEVGGIETCGNDGR